MKKRIAVQVFALAIAALMFSKPAAVGQSGLPLWTNVQFNSGFDFADAIATDNSGNVYVTGSATHSAAGQNFFTLKYSSNGGLNWGIAYNGPGNTNDAATDVVVDSKGNIIVTGSSTGSGTSLDFATIKYTNLVSAASPVWTNRYNGAANGTDGAAAMAIDANGNVFVTGYSLATIHPDYDFITIGYSAAGVPLWTNRYDGPANHDDRANSIVVDTNGNVFVTGYSSGTTNANSQDITTVAYSNAGVPLWTNRFNGAVNSTDLSRAITVDSAGNVFVAGSTRTATNNSNADFVTLAYSGAGVPLWTNFYNGGVNADDAPADIAVDNEGSVYVAGTGGVFSNRDFITIKYSTQGMALWTNRYNGTGNGHDSVVAMGLDARNNVFVTGQSEGVNFDSQDDFATISYSKSGTPLWTNRLHRYYNGSDQPRALAVSRAGDVFVTGSVSTGSDYEYMTVKYRSLLVPVITGQLTNRTVFAGSNVLLSVGVAGDPTFAFQWQKNGTNLVNNSEISGATSNPLVLSNICLDAAGQYRVLITNEFGNVTSATATLTVNCPTIPLSPTNLMAAPVNVAYSQTISATNGKGPYTFQVTGGTLPDGLSLDPSGVLSGTPTAAGRFIFTITATEACNCSGSRGYIFDIFNPPTLTLSTTNVIFGPGGFALSVNADGTGPFSYQWRLNGTNIANATNSFYAIPTSSSTNAGTYTVVVSNAAGSVTSGPVTASYFGDLQIYPGMTLAGQVGAQYRIEYADIIGQVTNDWQILTNITLPHSPFLIVDPHPAIQPQRLYRATILP